ncbi:MAG TPA: POTRA domain-containing protein, partial [Tepidisphaeraceae bacterium]|nr:POTRA domain-containing protein [Tepidisphaeraceae bacterium]
MLSEGLPQVKKDHFLLRRIVCISFVLLVLGQILSAPLFAQSTNPSVRNDLAGRTVESVRVLGNTSVSSAVILNLVRTHEGDKYDPQTAEEDYQRIFGLRKFSNVEDKVEPTDTGGVVVAFVVTEQKQIKSIAYRGNVAIDTPTLEQTVNVKIGEAIDRFRLAISRQAIVNNYKDRNFPFAHVDVDQDALASRGDVIFTIVEGPNVRIRNIEFIGAEHFTNDRLRGEIQTKTWIFVFRHGSYDPELVDDDVSALVRFYQQKGYFDVRVGRKLIWSPDMNELQVNFVIEEGLRYVVDRVTFKGNASVDEANLRKNLKLLEGIPYDNDLLQRDIRQIVKAYSPFGFIYQPQSQDPDYLRIEAKPVFSRQPGHAELVYDITEGKPFRLGRIIPKGNYKTQDKVILREMQMTPGQLYNSAGVQDAIDRLHGTPYFGKVNITPIGDDPDSR